MRKLKYVSLVVFCVSAVSSWALSKASVEHEYGPYGNATETISYKCCKTHSESNGKIVASWKPIDQPCQSLSTACTEKDLNMIGQVISKE
ncbi:MAG: hypothetical protein K0R14_1017 [Burkholderiales bacterium]|jgi:hypothetical protein|nr:hypothetical protein [Burkholderiales bacterium]